MKNSDQEIKSDHVSLPIQIKQKCHFSSDLKTKEISLHNKNIILFYIDNMTNSETLNKDVIGQLHSILDEPSLNKVLSVLTIAELIKSKDMDQIIQHILRGWTFLHIEGEEFGLLIDTIGMSHRNLSSPEVEGQILGPQVGFTESLTTNLSLIRGYISSPDLIIESLKVGKVTHTNISLVYINEIAAEQNVTTLRQRVTDLEVDGIISSSNLAQLIVDNSTTIFPLAIHTERPDRVSTSLLEGKIALFVDGSPFVIVLPSTFIDFFKSTEDGYIRWNMATFIRLLRIFGMLLSVLFSPLYVAALTYHYEVIPSAMLVQLAQSRAKVPFPPLFEALLLEIIIELLREAGARLPTKVGQTMGIVGGIVIGQAAVQAGFTSNILIMIVALGALSSFTAPSYLMGSAVRLIRFPMLLLAGMFGFIGIVYGACLLLIHLLKQTSLGSPYLYPFYPLRFSDLKKSIIRLPNQFVAERNAFSRSSDSMRYDEKKAKRKKDIDE